MSLYLSILFGLLVTEMAVLSILVLPLPFRVRKVIVNSFEKCLESSQLRTITAIGYVLVGMMFLDSWRRSTHRVGPDEGPLLEGSKTALQNYTSRTYHQRNLYLSGFILYFNICIPTVLKVFRSLNKHEEIRRRGVSKQDESSKLKELRKELQEKEASLTALKKQKGNLETHFDKINSEKSKSSSFSSKKDD